MRTLILALLTLVVAPCMVMAQSQERADAMLVLDGSGTMWGTIDGVNKIVIARAAITELLDNMAEDASLGLTAYGHRRRGDCTDVETLVQAAPGTRDRILEAVDTINPRGRTPMADAITLAAGALDHTQNPATIILISDGLENCNPDPCAVAQDLAATGADFTLHIIGFDLASEPEARAQMTCMADATGGVFLTAETAIELAEALALTTATLMTDGEPYGTSLAP